MTIIPLHLQRRFEQRWAARFGPLKRTTPPSGVSSLGGVAYFKLGPQIPSKDLSAQTVPRFTGPGTIFLLPVRHSHKRHHRMGDRQPYSGLLQAGLFGVEPAPS